MKKNNWLPLKKKYAIHEFVNFSGVKS